MDNFHVQCCVDMGLISDTANKSATSPQQVGNKSLQWNLGNDTTQQTQRTSARDNLLRTCYEETGVMDFDLNTPASYSW